MALAGPAVQKSVCWKKKVRWCGLFDVTLNMSHRKGAGLSAYALYTQPWGHRRWKDQRSSGSLVRVASAIRLPASLSWTLRERETGKNFAKVRPPWLYRRLSRAERSAPCTPCQRGCVYISSVQSSTSHRSESEEAAVRPPRLQKGGHRTAWVEATREKFALSTRGMWPARRLRQVI